MNYIYREVFWIEKEVTNLETETSAQEVYSDAISALEEIMRIFEQNLRELNKTNERIWSTLKIVNYVLESHVVVQNVANMTPTEVIHWFFVRLGDMDTISGYEIYKRKSTIRSRWGSQTVSSKNWKPITRNGFSSSKKEKRLGGKLNREMRARRGTRKTEVRQRIQKVPHRMGRHRTRNKNWIIPIRVRTSIVPAAGSGDPNWRFVRTPAWDKMEWGLWSPQTSCTIGY